MPSQTIMQQEALEAPDVIARQLEENKVVWQALSGHLKKTNIPLAVTIARGSSDHAATYAKYNFETLMGWPTVSSAPSITTVYDIPQNYKNALVIALSQSGQSPDICEVMRMARQQGAITVALINQVGSPLAKEAEYVVPLWAGQEKAVAATKSYLATMSTLAHFVATYNQDHPLLEALEALPERLQACCNLDWSPAINMLEAHHSALVLGRGYGFSVAQEAALKFKETSGIHAEAFSSAEVLHGPFALIKSGLPVLILPQHDNSLHGLIDLSRKMTQLGAKTMLSMPKGLADLSSSTCSVQLPLPPSLHATLDPLMNIQAFYMMLSDLALLRGYNPDQPDNLRKVTQTR